MTSLVITPAHAAIGGKAHIAAHHIADWIAEPTVVAAVAAAADTTGNAIAATTGGAATMTVTATAHEAIGLAFPVLHGTSIA